MMTADWLTSAIVHRRISRLIARRVIAPLDARQMAAVAHAATCEALWVLFVANVLLSPTRH